MESFLESTTERRRQLCQAAGDKIGLDAPSVEKDFWVCWTLQKLFTLSESGPHLTFKGGTSLSKGWKLIERFSEDIDVVIDRDFLGFSGDQSPEAAPSSKKRDQKLEELRTSCQKHIRENLSPALHQQILEKLPDTKTWKLTDDPADKDLQTLLFEYPTAFPPGTYLQPLVKIELGARSDIEPSDSPTIQSYLAEALPEIIAHSPFQVRTVVPERTFWEKAMLLHEEGYRTNAEAPKARLARHYYDLWCLIQAGVAKRAAADANLFERVAAHRAVFFRKKKEAQESLRRGSLRILPREERRPAWKQDYEAMREVMFFGDVPKFEEILHSVGEFEGRFNQRGGQ